MGKIEPQELLQTRDLIYIIDQLITLDAEEIDQALFDIQTELFELVREVCQEAYVSNLQNSVFVIQNVLYKIYRLHVSIPEPGQKNAESSFIITGIRNLLEKYFFANEDKAIPPSIWQQVPNTPKKYVKWLINIIKKHPTHAHHLYEEYLRKYATKKDLQQFLIQESTIDNRFDDFLALLQVGTDGVAKLEIASNYWDEMGNGDEYKMHTVMFSRTMSNLDIDYSEWENLLTTEALVCGNLSLMLSLHRKNYYKGIGYFAATEYMTPRRFKNVISALKRNEVCVSAAEYYKEHISIDAIHAINWFNNVIIPTIEKHPEAVDDITRGVFYRLNTSQKYLDSLLSKFAVVA
ncbi:MAG: iron-containing redox enzyme family protein [Moorea sp. SIO2I5]|nr:iron-containing redox enzyme family protein [Moorena sp. SIO2I5]